MRVSRGETPPPAPPRCPQGQWELAELERGCGWARGRPPAEQPGKERAERGGSERGCESEPWRGCTFGVSPRSGHGPSVPTQGPAVAWAEWLRTGQRLARGLAEGELWELGGTGGGEGGTWAEGGEGRRGAEGRW